MKLTLETLDEDFAKQLANETGIQVKLAPSYDTMSAFTIRTKPMANDVAHTLADYLKDNIEVGNNIGSFRVEVLGVADGCISIRGSDISGPIGNMYRLLHGDKPGLSIEEVIHATGVTYDREGSTADPTMLSIARRSDGSPVKNHIRQALISYIVEQAEKRGCTLHNESGEFVILPAIDKIEKGVDGAYAAMKNAVHRDRCVPYPMGEEYFTQGVYLAGGNAIGANPEQSRDPETVLNNVRKALIAAGRPEERATDQAKLLLLRGYADALNAGYPDITQHLIYFPIKRSDTRYDFDKAVDTLFSWPQNKVPAPPQPNAAPDEPQNPRPQTPSGPGL